MHLAKKLIDETSLPMNQIADASGFGSVRRFNAIIREFMTGPTTQIRRRARQGDPACKPICLPTQFSPHRITGSQVWLLFASCQLATRAR